MGVLYVLGSSVPSACPSPGADRLRKPCETPPATSGSYRCQNVTVRNGG
jgi:hypothetical protein